MIPKAMSELRSKEIYSCMEYLYVYIARKGTLDRKITTILRLELIFNVPDLLKGRVFFC